MNPSDPGVRMLGRAVAGVDPAKVVLVCCGDLPGLGAGATRLILDVRESESSVGKARPIGLSADTDPVPGVEVAAVWPRAHLGKDFTQQTLARAGLALGLGGRALCAVRKQKGAEGVADFMGELFGNVRVETKDKGYRLLRSDRTEAFDRPAAIAQLARRYRYEDPMLGDLKIETAPGVFSRRQLDEGTKCLIDHATRREDPPRRLLDLCCGVGTLALWALQRWPGAHGLAVDSNLLAAELATANAKANAMDDRLEVEARDGLPTLVGPRRKWSGTVDLALVNPPTHAEAEALRRLLGPLREWMRPGAPALLVASRPGTVIDAVQASGAATEYRAYERYTVVEARW